MLDILEKQIRELELAADKIEKKAEYLFQNATLVSGESTLYTATSAYWEPPGEDLKKLQDELIKDYEKWYSSSYHLIEEYIPERSKTFAELYDMSYGIADQLKLVLGFAIEVRKIDYINSWNNNFSVQQGILSSIPLVARIKQKSLRKILTADIAYSEIEEAELLYDNKHYRAAGAVAGVALERYLKTLCEINDITYKSKGISSLAQTLCSNDPPKLDKTEEKNMVFLAGIRNDCDHPNEISEEELKKRVQILIDQTKSYVLKL